MVAAYFAQAQSLMRPGQAIIFATPDASDDSSNASSPMAEPPVAPGFSDMIHAPTINFQNPSITSQRLPVPLPMTAAPVQDPRADWALMTPAEILGVATPEQILQVPERDAAGQRKNLTVVERYYERQDQAQTNGSGGFLPGTPSLHGDFQDNEDARLNASVFKPAGEGFASPAEPSYPFQQPAPGNGADASQNGDAGWSKNFILPPTSVQSPVQAADMAEFRKMLESSQPSRPSSSSSGDGFLPSRQTSPGSMLGQPMNQAGSSFGSFNSIGGLPGVAGQVIVPAVTTVPDWKPQPAPWMLKGPQPDVIPKRVVF